MGNITHAIKLAFFNQNAAMFIIFAAFIADGKCGQASLELINGGFTLLIIFFCGFYPFAGAQMLSSAGAGLVLVWIKHNFGQSSNSSISRSKHIAAFNSELQVYSGGHFTALVYCQPHISALVLKCIKPVSMLKTF